MSARSETVAARLSMAAVGTIAGLSAWALVDVVPDRVADPHLALALVAGGLGFFGVLLALLGPARLIPSALSAAALALPATLLFVWASHRYDTVAQFLDGPLHVTDFVILLAIPVPFIAAALDQPGGWRRYDMLFDLAWTIVVRYAAALLFLGMVWALLLLSDALLGLVGITVIEWLLDQDPFAWVLSGLVLGLGLAIVHEYRDYVSPFLIIQLLRVVLPVLLLVLAIFILALPFRGLAGLFGHFSAAVALTAVALAGVSLVTASVHRDDDLAVESRLMLVATQVMALLLPVPAALAIYALAQRVAQHGLTPDRVAGGLVALLVLAYAVLYAGSVLLRRNWGARIRRVNSVMALVAVALAALWLTPVLNAERISVAHQVARAERGLPPERLGLWEMAHDWGKAGQRGLARLRDLPAYPEPERLAAEIDRAEAAEGLWAYEAGQPGAGLDLASLVPVLPQGAALPEGGFDGLRDADRQLIAQACARPLPGGQPGCVVVLADFDPLRGTRSAIGLFLTGDGRVDAMSLGEGPKGLYRTGYVSEAGSDQPARLDAALLSEIVEGRFEIVPAPRNVLGVGEKRFFPNN